MNRRPPENAFCWDVPDDEHPLPLVDDPPLRTVDQADLPSPAPLRPTSNEFAGVRGGSGSLHADTGWTARLTVGVLAACVLAFGLGWSWGGQPTVDDSERFSSGKSASVQEWKEHRDD
jgi:hypothetical protein